MENRDLGDAARADGAFGGLGMAEALELVEVK